MATAKPMPLRAVYQRGVLLPWPLLVVPRARLRLVANDRFTGQDRNDKEVHFLCSRIISKTEIFFVFLWFWTFLPSFFGSVRSIHYI